jgi:NAD(P)-dependent dehydrogenase (short-subunit alcohol dehydrogenase family)
VNATLESRWMSADAPVVAVTGAGTGIGRACALRFARGGWHVLLAGRRREKLEAVAAEIRALPGAADCAVEPLDAAEPGAMEAAVGRLLEARGRLDALVANAGINPQRAPALETAEEHWRETLRVNLDGVRRSCTAALPAMIRARGGAIVTIGSVAGQTGMLARAAYGPSKAAVIAWTRNLALDYAPHGIRANCVCPAFVVTDINRGWLHSLPRAQHDALVAKHPLGLGQPEDVAAAAHFLCTPEARWITGVDLAVDGGFTAS